MIKNYNYFLEIEKQRNITKASENLYISQPTLSKYLNKLEEELGVKLIDRSLSPLKLTKAGILYLEFIKKYVKIEDDFISEIEKFKRPYKTVTVGISTWRGSSVIPLIYGEFFNKHTNYNIEFKEGSGSYIFQLLENNKIDFCMNNIISSSVSINLESEILDEEEVCIAMNKEHSYLKDKIDKYNLTVDLKELENETFILLQDSQILTKKVHQILDFNGVVPKRIVRTQNLTTAFNIASNTHGITFYPYSYRTATKINDNLVRLKIKGNNSKISFALVYKNSELSESCRTLINFIFAIYGVNKNI